MYIKPLSECYFKAEAPVERYGGFKCYPGIKKELDTAPSFCIAFHLGEQRFGYALSAIFAADKQTLDFSGIIGLSAVSDAPYRHVIIICGPYFFIFSAALYRV